MITAAMLLSSLVVFEVGYPLFCVVPVWKNVKVVGVIGPVFRAPCTI
jgi:hypothetical protein